LMNDIPYEFFDQFKSVRNTPLLFAQHVVICLVTFNISTRNEIAKAAMRFSICPTNVN
jgi:hypothetical protein